MFLLKTLKFPKPILMDCKVYKPINDLEDLPELKFNLILNCLSNFHLGNSVL